MFSLEYAFSVLLEGVVVGESKQGTQPYLAKPVDLATLTRVIEKHLK
jgi:FixJ family two-component response regulator